MAQLNLREGQFSDSLLNAIIGLEILFSERESTTAAISSRTAVLVHRQIGRAFVNVRDDITKLYDLRSGYVHRGKLTNAESCERAIGILQQVLKCLFRLQMNQESHRTWALKTYLKQLDWICASIEAGVEVSDEILTKHGIV